MRIDEYPIKNNEEFTLELPKGSAIVFAQDTIVDEESCPRVYVLGQPEAPKGEATYITVPTGEDIDGKYSKGTQLGYITSYERRDGVVMHLFQILGHSMLQVSPAEMAKLGLGRGSN